jgi:hypothetical protein
LNLDRALRRFQRAVELDQKCIADGFNFAAVKARKDFAEQLPMFFEQFHRKFPIAL